MPNIAETVKKQTDRILRQKALNGTDRIEVSGIATGTGAPAPTVNSPAADLATHKASGDHDGRYYTEAEVDALLTFLGLNDTPSTYVGEAGKLIAVNATEDGTEFVAAPPAENGVPPGGTTNQLAAKNSNDDYDIKWVDAPAAANGLPAGGTTGQVLAKNSDTDYDTGWIDAPSGGGGGEGAILPLDEPPASPSVWDDDFSSSTLDSKWAWVNQGTANYVCQPDSSSLKLTIPNGRANGCWLVQNRPAGDFVVRAKLIGTNNIKTYGAVGVVIGKKSSGWALYAGYHCRAANQPAFGQIRWTSFTSGAGDFAAYFPIFPHWVQIAVTGTTAAISYSWDGADFIPFVNISVPSDFDKIGIGGTPDGASVPFYGVFDWFRVTQ